MPFTLAHPASAALFRRLIGRDRLPLAAFAIGAMAPDFEYLLRLEPMAFWSHSPSGILVFCLPAGVVALAIWELLVRDPVRHLLGLPSDGALRDWWGANTSVRAARAVIALVLGSITHVVWDGFTHWDAWGVDLLPGLEAPALVVLGRAVPWYKLLQHSSSVFGGAVVLAWLWSSLHGRAGVREIAGTRWRRRALSGVALSVLAVAVWNANRSGWMQDPSRVKIVAGRFAVGGLVGLALGCVAFAVTYRVARSRAARMEEGRREEA